jgi:hypothetical protein
MNTFTEVAPVIMASQQPRASLAMRRMLPARRGYRVHS